MSQQPAGSGNCLCGRSLPYSACCGPYLDGGDRPGDAETLMRSRYCAYTLHNEAYLLATWHPHTRPRTLALEAEPQPRWLGLQVKAHAQQDAAHATVEFVARYKVAGRAFRMHELSRFVREDGDWYYLDGSQME